MFICISWSNFGNKCIFIFIRARLICGRIKIILEIISEQFLLCPAYLYSDKILRIFFIRLSLSEYGLMKPGKKKIWRLFYFQNPSLSKFCFYFLYIIKQVFTSLNKKKKRKKKIFWTLNRRSIIGQLKSIQTSKSIL